MYKLFCLAEQYVKCQIATETDIVKSNIISKGSMDVYNTKWKKHRQKLYILNICANWSFIA